MKLICLRRTPVRIQNPVDRRSRGNPRTDEIGFLMLALKKEKLENHQVAVTS